MVKITEVEELREQIQIAIDCLDNICSTHANSAAYRDIAKESLQKILLRKENAVSNET
jgi:hypothetical protein